MVKLEVEISSGTMERLRRKFREETGIWCVDPVQADEFDLWFDKWLNKTLFNLSREKSREEEIGEMARAYGED